MPSKRPFARIAITLPPETLRSADDLAARHDRSRSWIVAEAIRQYAASESTSGAPAAPAKDIGASRLAQLRRDAALSPEERVLQAQEVASLGAAPGRPEPPRTFKSYAAFQAWRRKRRTS